MAFSLFFTETIAGALSQWVILLSFSWQLKAAAADQQLLITVCLRGYSRFFPQSATLRGGGDALKTSLAKLGHAFRPVHNRVFRARPWSDDGFYVIFPEVDVKERHLCTFAYPDPIRKVFALLASRGSEDRTNIIWRASVMTSVLIDDSSARFRNAIESGLTAKFAGLAAKLRKAASRASGSASPRLVPTAP